MSNSESMEIILVINIGHFISQVHTINWYCLTFDLVLYDITYYDLQNRTISLLLEDSKRLTIDILIYIIICSSLTVIDNISKIAARFRTWSHSHNLPLLRGAALSGSGGYRTTSI